MKFFKNFSTLFLDHSVAAHWTPLKKTKLLEQQINKVAEEGATSRESKDKTHLKVAKERTKEMYSKVSKG